MTIGSNMNSHTSSLVPPMLRSKTTILDKSLSRGKQEISLAGFALLFSETVQYCQVVDTFDSFKLMFVLYILFLGKI